MIPCNRCGKPATIQGLCEKCFSKTHSILEVENLRARRCKLCLSYFINSKKFSEIEDIIWYALKNLGVDFLLVRKFSAERKSQILFSHRISQNKLSIDLKGRFYLTKNQRDAIFEQKEFEILLKPSVCRECEILQTSYYEAILQVRRDEKPLDSKLERKIFEILKKNKFSIKTEKKREGIDFRFVRKNEALKAANLLKNKLGGRIKKTIKNVSKEKKRLTIALRLPEYEEGEILLLSKKAFKITKVHPKLKIENLEEERSFELETVEKLRKEGKLRIFDEVPLRARVISVIPQEVELMLSDFTTLIFEKPKDLKLTLDMEFQVILEGGEVSWLERL
ncbi:MAG: NMD3-related protein [Candidatus Methanofastidiosia archaeon]